LERLPQENGFYQEVKVEEYSQQSKKTFEVMKSLERDDLEGLR
jgi:hypothetical protein